MKTLREMMDQLDEISRRDFLKGAGAAAVAGAAGGAEADWVRKPDYKDPMDDKVYRSFTNISTDGSAALEFFADVAPGQRFQLAKRGGKWSPPVGQNRSGGYSYLFSNGRIRVDGGPVMSVGFTIPEIQGEPRGTGRLALMTPPDGGLVGPAAEKIENYLLSAKDKILIDVTELSGGQTVILTFNINSMKEDQIDEASPEALDKINKLFQK